MQTSFCLQSSSRLSRTALSIALSAALAALCASNVQAAETTLPEVVVSGAAAGAQSWAQWQNAIDLAQRRAATNDTASLLLGIPGLSVNAAGGVSGLPQYNGLSDDNLNIQLDGMGLIADIVKIYRNYSHLKTEVLVASIRHPMHLVEAAKLGAGVATLTAVRTILDDDGGLL